MMWLALVVGSVAVYCVSVMILGAMKVLESKGQKVYKYRYQRFPFDGQQIFTIYADTQEEANELAIKEMQRLFDAKVTIMTCCYPV